MAREKKWVFNQIFDPSSEFIVRWNGLIFVVGLMNFYLDPMFMYVSTLNNSKTVMTIDVHLGATLSIMRMMGDFFLILGILVKFRTAYEAPGSKVFKRRRLILDPKQIAIKYLKSTFVVDLLAALPLPQVYLWHWILASKSASRTSPIKDIAIYFDLYDIFWLQILPRMFVVFYSKLEITKTVGILLKSAMSGAFYNLLSFMNLSNIVGAMYYHTHIYWVLRCVERIESTGLEHIIYEYDQFLSNCTENYDIQPGMFSSALTNKIGMRNFIQRYMFCFSWGLKSLSSLGQNFTTSFSTLETAFSISVTLLGLIYFADLITRMQAGIQSMEEREEQQRVRLQEIREWMDYHQLPFNLKERVNHAIQSEWTESGINDEAILDSLPMNLQSEIRRYLYMDLVCKLPKFADMDSQLVEAVCQHLRTFSSREGTCIVYEGDLIRQMLFIFSGQLEISFKDSGNSSLTILESGDICGQELVTWASQSTTSMQNLPSSPWTIKCLTDVEAFTLQAYDMKILATQFAQNREFQQAFKQHYP